MTTDIDFRQSGKTTRLVEDVKLHLGQGGRAIIVTVNHQMKEHIERMCFPFKKSKRLKFSTQYTIDQDSRGLSDDYRRYWDEFLLMEPKNVIYRTGDYYCGTTREMEEDQVDEFKETGVYPHTIKTRKEFDPKKYRQ